MCGLGRRSLVAGVRIGGGGGGGARVRGTRARALRRLLLRDVDRHRAPVHLERFALRHRRGRVLRERELHEPEPFALPARALLVRDDEALLHGADLPERLLQARIRARVRQVAHEHGGGAPHRGNEARYARGHASARPATLALREPGRDEAAGTFPPRSSRRREREKKRTGRKRPVVEPSTGRRISEGRSARCHRLSERGRPRECRDVVPALRGSASISPRARCPPAPCPPRSSPAARRRDRDRAQGRAVTVRAHAALPTRAIGASVDVSARHFIPRTVAR